MTDAIPAPGTIVPRVVDLSHHNVVKDFGAAAGFGLWGVIHKATQGKAYADPDYAGRRETATAAGLMWGAYHFATGDDIAVQVDWFLAHAKPDDTTLLALDYEDNRLSQMSVHQVVAFLRLIEAKVGRKAAVYSGNRIKENIGLLGADDRAYLATHRLWLCQYGPAPHLPAGFETCWLWQYTGDGTGPKPHTVPGIIAGNGGLDLNSFQGTREDLAASWA
ncbi:MAG TPA: glycoside hydrolase family 25 protein [Candidatus Cybelea sp.]|nr:glycoside hydrolase family 25 protein [Candidatus Cybelea sp.]